GRRQHAAGAELPVERLDVGDDETGRVRRAHPDRVALTVGLRPLRRLAAVDLFAFGVKEVRVEIAQKIAVYRVGIGDLTVAHDEGALGRFDQAVNVGKAVAFGDAQAVEQGENDERGQTLGRRRRVVESPGTHLNAQRFGNPGFVFFQIRA